jgi:hypothetical protein
MVIRLILGVVYLLCAVGLLGSWLSEAAEFFFVAADGGGDGVQRDSEVGDLGGESSQGVCLFTVRAVFFDDCAQVGVSVEGGSPESGAGGDLIECDGFSSEDYCGACVFDGSAALLGGHRVCA